MRKPYIFRCVGRSDRSEMHLISVGERRAQCSCQGVDWCSHIEATLADGERHMVPEEDRKIADKAMRLIRPILHAPTGWQSSWRDDRVWRGLAAPRSGEIEKIRWDGRPTVCFLGSGPEGPRSEYEDQANSLGWRIIEHPSEYTTLIVCSGKAREERRGVLSRALRLPIIDHAQWSEWQYDMTNAVMDRIEHHGFDPTKHIGVG